MVYIPNWRLGFVDLEVYPNVISLRNYIKKCVVFIMEKRDNKDKNKRSKMSGKI